MERIAAARPLVAFAQHAMLASLWKMRCDSLERAIAGWHAAQPESIGPRPADLKGALPAVIARLVQEGRLVREGPWLHLPGHQPLLSAADEALWKRAAPLLEESPQGKPLRVHELAPLLGMEPKAVTDFLNRAARAGRVYRVAPNRFLLPARVDSLVGLAVALDEESAGRGFPAALYRDRSGLGRNLSIQVLEFLDAAGYTKRAGELRRARNSLQEEQRPRWGARTSNPERGV
jgi:selenocysteine-specific elongation factor